MAEVRTRAKSAANGKQAEQSAAQQAINHRAVTFELPVIGEISFPSPEHVAWYAGVVVLVAFEVIEWPIALVLATGRVLADNHHSQVLEQFGLALEEAG